jgi:hypothetical protein
VSDQDKNRTERREYLFHLIERLNWDDESQERFLARNRTKSWISANSKTIEKAIEKMLDTAKMFMVDINTENDLDAYEDEG